MRLGLDSNEHGLPARLLCIIVCRCSSKRYHAFALLLWSRDYECLGEREVETKGSCAPGVIY